jgi:hypothetical protein
MKKLDHAAKAMTDAEKVAEYMRELDHPLQAEMEAVRVIIKQASNKISERIKWAAPSYYCGKSDLVTFNHRAQDRIHLVFHHPAIVLIPSDLLEGAYKDRRMAYFYSMEDVEAKRLELARIVNALIEMAIDQ